MQALQQGTQKIAVLTDQTNTPGAIASLILADLTNCSGSARIWVARRAFNRGLLKRIVANFAPLNVVVYSASLTQRLITVWI